MIGFNRLIEKDDLHDVLPKLNHFFLITSWYIYMYWHCPSRYFALIHNLCIIKIHDLLQLAGENAKQQLLRLHLTSDRTQRYRSGIVARAQRWDKRGAPADDRTIELMEVERKDGCRCKFVQDFPQHMPSRVRYGLYVVSIILNITNRERLWP
jgi:hypothetical protein